MSIRPHAGRQVVRCLGANVNLSSVGGVLVPTPIDFHNLPFFRLREINGREPPLSPASHVSPTTNVLHIRTRRRRLGELPRAFR